ncbi:hypothetical protein [Microbacterium thalassium]|uniref:Uncharacterized protein n=1 Tax=Microbacterium thalassium TaxID=362649 RepID=A0A7X0FNF1_9MICO|nr:hypothetical protein [Microbacterium thalassium]MBB6390733.1 hypothetical protein [Microbacterium thalassium]
MSAPAEVLAALIHRARRRPSPAARRMRPRTARATFIPLRTETPARALAH